MKYSINFTPEKCRNNAAEGNVRMIVQWSGGGRVSLFVGHRVVLAKWSKEAQRCKNNTMHGVYMAARINKDIQHYEDVVNKVMQGFDEPPTNADAKDAITSALGKAKRVEANGRSFRADFTQFMLEQAKLKSWSDSTSNTFRTMWNTFVGFNKDIGYADVNTGNKQDLLISYLQDQEYKASSIREYIAHLNWFLRWAEKKGYIPAAPNYRPVIKTAPKKVIFLTKEELFALYNAEFDDRQDRRIRDFFCFSCFTGLRHSDVFALRKGNIQDGVISIISKKDVDNLNIELNKYSREILQRVELSDREINAGRVLPCLDASRLNNNIKRLAKECGINSPIQVVYYRGNKRIVETKEKWELISSHVGRKTFICTALSQGISPAVIMKWTGHSDYKAMRPYIDIVDEAKKTAMAVFDTL